VYGARDMEHWEAAAKALDENAKYFESQHYYA